MTAELRLEKICVQKSTLDGRVNERLQDISLACHVDERIGLFGRHGSGKTTLARILCGLERPTQGKRRLSPKNVGVSLVLQRPENHFIRETVIKQVASYAPKKLSITAVEELLTKVGLPSDIGKEPPLHLSGGQQRLVAIACALASDASFIIFDEPMAGLDRNGRRQVSQTLVRLGSEQKLGVIIISHHPDDLLGLIDRLWILDEGKLIYDGSFLQMPMSFVNTILSPKETSLYYILRQLESRGVQLPKSIYNGLEPEEIAQILSGANLS